MNHYYNKVYGGQWVVRRVVLLFTLYYSLFIPSTASAQQMISGTVTDAQTGEPIPFASVQYKGHNIGVASDIDGNYRIARHNGWPLTFSAVGYVAHTSVVNSNVKSNYFVKLKADNNVLKEVTVKTKRGRYSRKNNPAVEMMKKVIAAKKRSDLMLSFILTHTM